MLEEHLQALQLLARIPGRIKKRLSDQRWMSNLLLHAHGERIDARVEIVRRGRRLVDSDGARRWSRERACALGIAAHSLLEFLFAASTTASFEPSLLVLAAV